MSLPDFKSSRRPWTDAYFQVGVASVYRWLRAADGLAYRRTGPRGLRRLDWEALRAHAEAHPDWTLRERARHFGASRNGVWYALRRLGVSRKKNAGLPRARPPQAPSLRPLARPGAAAGESVGLRGRERL
ncbi:MAG TPA: hypothetical protein DIC59_04515 [Candidatus Competibacteraceae bacterium]|nr:hypothetical protein [Candidatus Competibacteraceae bacterium]